MSTSSVGRPGKYQRSAGGLVTALLITVVAVGGLLWVLGLFRSDTSIRPDEVDYLAIAGEAQDAELAPVYPASLPDGWFATAYEIQPGEEPVLEIRLLTGDDDFAGIHQSSASASELVRTYVDEDATPTDIYSDADSVAGAWQGYEDEGGDTAYAAEVGGKTVLVYGSASAEELQDLIGRLTTEPVPN